VHHFPDVNDYLFILLSFYLFIFFSYEINVNCHANSARFCMARSPSNLFERKGRIQAIKELSGALVYMGLAAHTPPLFFA
jgi:hypothetical protein